MKKRMLLAFLFVPAVIIVVFIQLPYQVLKWIVTGISPTDPWFDNFFFN